MCLRVCVPTQCRFAQLTLPASQIMGVWLHYCGTGSKIKYWQTGQIRLSTAFSYISIQILVLSCLAHGLLGIWAEQLDRVLVHFWSNPARSRSRAASSLPPLLCRCASGVGPASPGPCPSLASCSRAQPPRRCCPLAWGGWISGVILEGPAEDCRVNVLNSGQAAHFLP